VKAGCDFGFNSIVHYVIRNDFIFRQSKSRITIFAIFYIITILAYSSILPTPLLAASLLLVPDSGTTGTEIAVSGSGFEASRLTYVWFDSIGNNTRDTGEPYVFTQTTDTGDLTAGLTLTAPDVDPDDYQVLVDVLPFGTIDASATFTHTGVAPELFLDPDSGPAGTSITVTGTNFDTNTSGYIWFDTDRNSVIDAGEPFLAVTTTENGEIPDGMVLTVPEAPLGIYPVRADIPEGDVIEASADFNENNTTLSVSVTRYATDNTTVLAQTTVDYLWMIDNLDIYGDGVTHYYHQGPTFAPDNMWDSGISPEPAPGETINVDSRDMGAVMGSDVKDLCDLVGGASSGDVIQIMSPDGFYKYFDYEDVYYPEPEQGRMVVTWYNAEFGFVPDYDTGMRLVFLAETLNPDGKYVFGHWDMHETLAEERWYYYYDGSTYWPSSGGLSVKWVSNINIYSSTSPEFISFTISDYGSNGIWFSNLDPGETGEADNGGSTGAITITVEDETNVPVDIQLMGTDFTGNPAGTIPVENVLYDSDNNTQGAIPLTESYFTWYSVGAYTTHVQQVYYWLTIPPGQIAGDYTSTFYFRAIAS
jgi:hypothetical protein